ncbi:helix-turn-helix domain-containing protein [Streptococcus ruminantium]|uniref:helix-turn-helix domain-containing protein n=1 Tax=Streptococcus ruminantium TaxID=1917441 RepID=UPI000423DB50|nr:helix-turn-helix transcriptional regulator [Streptococcus ruminantium]BDD43413.1 XRE family transcriptional regulator [Streptococcus ruminantium]
MKSLLATRLKLRRKELGWSQKELAEGLCDQGQISRMEKGAYMPGSDLLYFLAKKMQVHMEYFFDENEREIVSDLKQFRKITKDYLKKKDFETIAFLYEKEKMNSSRLTFPDQIYMEWLEAILVEEREGKYEESLEKYKKLLKRVGVNWKGYLYLYDSLLAILIRINKHQEVERLYAEIMDKIDSDRLETSEDMTYYFSIKSNYSRYLWLTNQIEKGIEVAADCLEEAKELYPIDLFAAFYRDLGNVTEEFADKDIVKRYYEMSQILYSTAGISKLALKVEKHLKENYSE